MTGSLRTMFAGAVVLLAACGGSGGGGIGAPGARATLGVACDIGNSINLPTVLAVNPDAGECGSKLCLFPAQERSTGTGPLCTAPCASDTDCASGQVRSNTPGDRRCQMGFVCRTLLPKLENNPLSCQSVCVCRDFLSSSDPNLRPPSCP